MIVDQWRKYAVGLGWWMVDGGWGVGDGGLRMRDGCGGTGWGRKKKIMRWIGDVSLVGLTITLLRGAGTFMRFSMNPSFL